MGLPLIVLTTASVVCLAWLAQGRFAPGLNLTGVRAALERQVPLIAAATWPVLTVMLVALPFQVLYPAIRRKPKFLNYEYYLDFLFAVQSIWLSACSFFVLVGALQIYLYGPYKAWFPSLSSLPFALQVFLAVWVFDFAVYWRHRLEHRFAPLWSFHAVHHTTEHVDVLTATRLHPFEVALGSLFHAGIVRTGLSAEALSLGFGMLLICNYFIHTNVRLKFNGPAKYVFVTPFMHFWHHATDLEARNKNFGVVFAWNDWIFGTAYHPQHWPTNFGLGGPESEAAPQTYFRQVLYPLQYIYVKLRRRGQACSS
jgi:sterol desaturase/sphingolipid hydroxylase (fatty acid hydroxylase superfamily)